MVPKPPRRGSGPEEPSPSEGSSSSELLLWWEGTLGESVYLCAHVCVCVCVCVRVCVCVCWSVKSFSINRTAQHTRSSQDQHFPSLLPTQSTISPSCTTHISAFLHKVVCLPMALPLHTTDLGLLTLPTKPANAQMLQQRKWTSDIPAVP